MNISLIFVTVILVAVLLYLGARLSGRLPSRHLWLAGVLGLGIYAVLLWGQVAAWPISNLVVLIVAILAAALIGRTLTAPSAVIAFCVAAGVVDFFSFSGGLTAQIMADFAEGRSLLLQYLSIAIPMSGQIVPIIGIGDLIILGSIYASLSQMALPGWLNFLVPLGGLLSALVVGLLSGGIYALPFIGGATVVYLLVHSKLKEQAANTAQG